MKRVRLGSLVAAIVVTAIQWAAFFSPALYSGSLRVAAAPLADGMSDRASPAIVVTARRQPIFKY